MRNAALWLAHRLEAESRDYTALWLCVTGLAAIFVTGYLGYFILNTIWGTYYSVPPTFRETNVVVIAVGLSAALYLIGVVLAYLSILHVTDYKVQRP